MKPAIKNGFARTNVPGKERLVRLNMQINRNMNSRIPREEEFDDKE
jgi:hypothetical protein